jgi:hypothetical protein
LPNGPLKAAQVKESEINGCLIQSLSYPLNPRQVLASQEIFSLFGIPQFLERVHQIEGDKVDTLFNLLEVIKIFAAKVSVAHRFRVGVAKRPNIQTVWYANRHVCVFASLGGV